MNKKILSLFVLILFVLMTIAIFSLNVLADISVPNTTITGTPSQTTTNIITITNNGNVTINSVTIEASALYKLPDIITGITIAPHNINNFTSGNNENLQYTVVIPSNQTLGTYTGTISVRNDDNGSLYTGYVTLTVQPNSGVSSLSIPTELVFGGPSQERGVIITKTFTITNNGGTTINNLILTTNANSKYETVITPSNVAILNPGQVATITITIKVPLDQDSGLKTIGSILLTATGPDRLISQSIPLKLETESNLEIRKVRVTINDEDSSSIDDGDDFNVKPGDKVTLEIEVRNTLSNQNIKNVDIDVINDDLDVDETESIKKINDGEKKTVEVAFTIERDIDEDDYEIEINAQGTDEEGATHQDFWVIIANVERKKHDLQIKDISINPSTIRCEKTARLSLTIDNIGSSNEKDVMIEIKSEDLNNYFQRVRDLSVDEDDSITRTFTINIPETRSNNVETAWFTVIVYGNGNKLDEELVPINIGECKPTTPTTPSTPTTPTIPTETPTIPTTNFPPTGEVIYGKPKTNFTDSWAYILLLGLAAVLIIVIIVVLLIKAMK
ncbi:MAG: hypothetical protein QXG00_04290 [Candidatus Woesearchaeota archaeon]